MKLSQQQEADLEIVNKMRELKKMFKGMSKNQLIHFLLQQIALLAEHQNINRVLLEQNEQLKKEKGEPKND